MCPPASKSPAFIHALSGLGRAFCLTLNRPERRNALGGALVQALQNCTQQLEAEVKGGSCRGVLLHSAVPGVFCAGADLKERHSQTPQEILQFGDNVRGIIARLERLGCPVVAAIDGAALGGGLELALGADVRVVSPRSVLGFPETSLGIIPGVGGTQRTIWLIGPARTKLLLFTARRLSGAEAVQWGLAEQLAEDPVTAATQMLQACMRNAPLALASAKAAVNDGGEVPLPAGMAFERMYYERLFGTQDRLEALAAFREKRLPVFEGR